MQKYSQSTCVRKRRKPKGRIVKVAAAALAPALRPKPASEGCVGRSAGIVVLDGRTELVERVLERKVVRELFGISVVVGPPGSVVVGGGAAVQHLNSCVCKSEMNRRLTRLGNSKCKRRGQGS